MKKYRKDKKKCEEGNMEFNVENVPNEHIICSNQINIRNVISKYNTTTDQTKRHIKIYTKKNPHCCSLLAKKFISRSHMKSHARENLNPYAVCGRKVISKKHSKRRSKSIIEKNLYHCTLCGKGLISRKDTKRRMKSLAR